MEKKKDEDRLAVALKYDQEAQDAPRVVAKGRGDVAENIREKAEEVGIKSIENRELVTQLMTLELQEEIPEELYNAVAEIMAYIYSLDEESGWRT